MIKGFFKKTVGGAVWSCLCAVLQSHWSELRQGGLTNWIVSARLKEEMQIDGLEEKLARCRQSMEEVDLKLRREKLSPEGRKSLERERNLLMTKADNYEKELSVLRKENRKNAALAVAMGLLIALIYACWTM
ncbi:coiled-coil domain-containing protein 167 isoform 1-T1 [Ciconia maguari]